MTQAVNSGYVTICSENPNGGNLFIHERDENGKMQKTIDGFGDVKEVAQRYMAEGFDPKKIKINGQLASDVFQLNTKEEEPKKNFFQRIKDKLKILSEGAVKYSNDLREEIATVQGGRNCPIVTPEELKVAQNNLFLKSVCRVK